MKRNLLIVIVMCAVLVIGCDQIHRSARLEPFPGFHQAELWVIAGQSNTHCGSFSQKDMTGPYKDIWMLNMNGQWMPAQDPLHRFYDTTNPAMKNTFMQIFGGLAGYTEETWEQNKTMMAEHPEKVSLLGTGPGLSFAYHLQKAIHKPIGLVPCGLGASTMQHWDPNRKDAVYQHMMDQLALVDHGINGIIWCQGESDTVTEETVANYESVMLGFIDRVRADLENPQLPFLIIQIGRYCNSLHSEANASWETIREAQRRLPMMRDNVFVISSSDLPLDDPIHVAHEGHLLTGKRLSELALTYLHERSGHGKMIQPVSVERIDPEQIISPPCFGLPFVWKIRFSGVSGSLHAEAQCFGFEIRKPDSSKIVYSFYRTEVDPDDPTAIRLYVSATEGPEKGLQLYYAAGMCSSANIRDEKNMPLPAFGPVELPLEGKVILEQ